MIEAPMPSLSIAQQFATSTPPPSPALVKIARHGLGGLSIQEQRLIVESDAELSLRVVSVANSSFYSPCLEVKTVQGALVALGWSALQALATGLLARSFVTTESGSEERVWRFSQAVGIGARLIAEHHCEVSPNTAYLAGLLSEVGTLAMLRAAPDYASLLEKSLCGPESTRRELELAEYGATHQAVAAEMIEIFGLPSEIGDALVGGALHVEKSTTSPLTAAVHFARELAHQAGFGLHESCAIDTEGLVRQLELNADEHQMLVTELTQIFEEETARLGGVR
ncbi:MAG: HDOD domain-containing protein [Pseudomonadota bacterium]